MSRSKIKTASITDDAITNAKIDANAVGTTEVADDAITGAKIENSPTIATNLNVTGDLTVDTNLFKIDAANNRIGIGTINPEGNLHIAQSGTGPAIFFEGATSAEGDIAIDHDEHLQIVGWKKDSDVANILIDIDASDGHFGFNQAVDGNSNFKFNIDRTMNTSMDANKIGLYLDVDYDGTIDTNGDRAMYGVYMEMDHNVSGGNTSNNEQILYGMRLDIDYNGNETNDIYGFQVQVDNNASNTTATTQIAGDFQSIADNAAGDITNLYGVRSLVHTDNNSGVEAVHDAYGMYTKVFNSSDGGKYTGNVNAGYFELEFANLSTSSHETELVGENAYVVRAEFDNNTSNSAIMNGTSTLFYGNYAGTMHSGTKYGIWLPDANISNVISGSLSKGSGSFRIPHPLPALNDTKDLVHSFVEGPQADNLYRGKVVLSSGSATVDIDSAAGMTDGTFVLLNRDVQCFTTNETGWTAIKGSVTGNQLSIIAQDSSCTDTISWMVIGERQDQHMYDTQWTDSDGRVIVEPDKLIPAHLEYLDSDEV